MPGHDRPPAQAQPQMQESADSDQAVAQRVINGLLDMRSKIEKELDARFLTEEA